VSFDEKAETRLLSRGRAEEGSRKGLTGGIWRIGAAAATATGAAAAATEAICGAPPTGVGLRRFLPIESAPGVSTRLKPLARLFLNLKRRAATRARSIIKPTVNSQLPRPALVGSVTGPSYSPTMPAIAPGGSPLPPLLPSPTAPALPPPDVPSLPDPPFAALPVPPMPPDPAVAKGLRAEDTPDC
jgi:hypothetical protein